MRGVIIKSCQLSPDSLRYSGRNHQILCVVPTFRRKKGTEKLVPVTCAHTEAEEGYRLACPCHLCPRCDVREAQEGVRCITAKVKTVICEQAPNHGSYFAYARLCFRNFQVTLQNEIRYATLMIDFMKFCDCSR